MSYRDLLPVLEQDETWTTFHGDRVPLADLGPTRRASLLAWLNDHARPLFEASWAPRHIGGDRALGMALARGMDEAPDPHEWLYEQPLLVRLVHLICEDEDDAEQGRAS